MDVIKYARILITRIINITSCPLNLVSGVLGFCISQCAFALFFFFFFFFWRVGSNPSQAEFCPPMLHWRNISPRCHVLYYSAAQWSEEKPIVHSNAAFGRKGWIGCTLHLIVGTDILNVVGQRCD